ncbi:MAG: type II secretion system F family protein [Desulfobacteraceae bacterium]|nr:type II secretion system F family protein [Desulfobacteraceae bacterium]
MAISYNSIKRSSPVSAGTAHTHRVLQKDGFRSVVQGLFSRIRSSEVSFFISQLSLMIEIGTPLNLAIKSIEREIKNPAFKKVLSTLYQEIEEGRQLSEAMAKHPRVFDHTTVSMIRAGERGGFMKKILDRIVELHEKRQALVSQLQSALTYPCILLIVGLIVIIFVLTGVLPKFTAFFEGKEKILPVTTRFLMAASVSLKSYWWAYLAGLAGSVAGIWIWLKSAAGRKLLDRVLIQTPVVRTLVNQIHTCALLRTMGNLLESRVPLLEALKVTRPTISNVFYRQFIGEIAHAVDQGGRFSMPFAAADFLPETVKQMVTVGEEVGQLPKVLLRLAVYYDVRIDEGLKKFAALVEPVALILMGIIVGIIVSSVILPMFKLAQAVA